MEKDDKLLNNNVKIKLLSYSYGIIILRDTQRRCTLLIKR